MLVLKYPRALLQHVGKIATLHQYPIDHNDHVQDQLAEQEPAIGIGEKNKPWFPPDEQA